jgi:hypothetical protein
MTTALAISTDCSCMNDVKTTTCKLEKFKVNLSLLTVAPSSCNQRLPYRLPSHGITAVKFVVALINGVA